MMSQILVRLPCILIKTPQPGDLDRQDLPEDDLRVRTVESDIEWAWHGVCVSQAAPPYTYNISCHPTYALCT